jgi:iron complex transport system permease protein
MSSVSVVSGRSRQSTVPVYAIGTSSQRGALMLGVFSVVLVVIVLMGVGIGAVQINPDQVIGILLDEFNRSTGLLTRLGITVDIDFAERQRAVLMVIRLPRVVLGLLIGSSLAVSGAAIQGLFRNPLADPGLIGISSGSALSAALIIVLGNGVLRGVVDVLGGYALPLAAFAGGFLTTILIYRLATIGGKTSVSTMLLAGIAINAIAGAGIGMMTFLATDDQLRDITFWSLGSLGRANWRMIAVIWPFMLGALLFIPFLSRALNALLLGEAEAGHLGINVERVKTIVVLVVAGAVGAGVAIAGIIGFLGLVIPHLVRLTIGPDHRYVLPGSVLLGASLLVGTDLIARTIAVPAEVPIGIVTAIVGGPFFLWLLLRDRLRGTWS